MITWVFVPLGLILPDQPNRVVRTRTLRGVGGGSCEAPPYPDSCLRYASLDTSLSEMPKASATPFP